MGAQARRLEADSAMIMTLVATGADTTRPLGWGAVTATCRGEDVSSGVGRTGKLMGLG